MLVKAGAPVESTIDLLMPLLEKGDIIIDGGNEWYENTEHRQKKVADKGLMYLGMGVSGGEEGARNGETSTMSFVWHMGLSSIASPHDSMQAPHIMCAIIATQTWLAVRLAIEFTVLSCPSY